MVTTIIPRLSIHVACAHHRANMGKVSSKSLASHSTRVSFEALRASSMERGLPVRLLPSGGRPARCSSMHHAVLMAALRGGAGLYVCRVLSSGKARLTAAAAAGTRCTCATAPTGRAPWPSAMGHSMLMSSRPTRTPTGNARTHLAHDVLDARHARVVACRALALALRLAERQLVAARRRRQERQRQDFPAPPQTSESRSPLPQRTRAGRTTHRSLAGILKPAR